MLANTEGPRSISTDSKPKALLAAITLLPDLLPLVFKVTPACVQPGFQFGTQPLFSGLTFLFSETLTPKKYFVNQYQHSYQDLWCDHANAHGSTDNNCILTEGHSLHFYSIRGKSQDSWHGRPRFASNSLVWRSEPGSPQIKKMFLRMLCCLEVGSVTISPFFG